MKILLRKIVSRRDLPRGIHAATRHFMRGRLTSMLVLMGLLFGIVGMPAIARASDHSPVHATEMLNVHEVGDVDHSPPQSGDTDMPCHATSHHHCSIALQLDAPRISLAGLAQAMLVCPAATAALLSRSQAPRLDPPNA